MNSESETISKPVEKTKTRWLLRKLRIALFIVVCLATAWGLFHVEEYWRGKRAWLAYKNDLIAKGEWYDLARMVPPKVPDDQNFAMTPMLAGLLQGDRMPSDEEFARSRVVVPKYLASWGDGKATDFNALAQSLQHTKSQKSIPPSLSRSDAIALIDSATVTNEAKLNEIREALKRPYSRFNVFYDKKDKASILLPHLASVKMLSQAFALKASEQLAQGQVDSAFENMESVFQLADKLKSEPILISQLVREAIFQIACQPLWEGMARHQWSDEQLAKIQKQMDDLDFLKDMLLELKIDRDVFLDSMFSSFRQTPAQGIAILQDIFSDSLNYPEPLFNNFLLHLAVPEGWVYFEELNTYRSYEYCNTSVIDVNRRRIDPKLDEERLKVRAEETQSLVKSILLHRLTIKMVLPGWHLTPKIAKNQTILDLARIACALERYRLANGQYPEKLDDLAPKYLTALPHDIITGEPLKYHLDPRNQFYLYSVAWDGKDNQGVPTKPAPVDPIKLSFLREGETEGDWVWTYPPQD